MPNLNDVCQKVEARIVEIFKAEWEKVGNVKVKTIQPAHTTVDWGSTALPAIFIEVSDLTLRGFVGGAYPLITVTVSGVLPWRATVDIVEQLRKMGDRIATVLLNHIKEENLWNDLAIESVSFRAEEAEAPRWRAVAVQAKVMGLPFKYLP